MVNLGLAVWAMWPSKKYDIKLDDDEESQGSPTESTVEAAGGKAFEMQPNTPRTITTPFTPRTQAFNTLDRRLPLRS